MVLALSQVRARAIVAITAAAGMVVVLMPGTATAQEDPESRGIANACPPPEEWTVDSEEMLDAMGTHQEAVWCAADYGLVQGFPDGTYRPGVEVTRGQMATFIRNWMEIALGEELPVPDEPPFPDIEGTEHEASIAALAGVGLVDGREDNTYGPQATVTRGQMSRFIYNALDFADNPSVTGTVRVSSETEFFADAVGTFFQADIQALASVGIVEGSDGAYNPAGPVTRGQLASFLMRAADFMALEQRWFPKAVEITDTVTLSWENELEVDEDTGEVTFGVGEEGAEGEATIEIDAFAGTLTWEVEYAEVTGPFDDAPGLHIHVGAIDENGPIVAFLADGDALQAEADTGVISGEFLEADVAEDSGFRLADLIEDPESYYVNLHSDDFPAGAIRGQFPIGGQDELPDS